MRKRFAHENTAAMTDSSHSAAGSVLIVDDCRTTRMILRRALEALSFVVDEAVHGQDALQRCDANGGYDLALIDWNMPVMDGLNLVYALNEKPQYQQMSILMISTRNERHRLSDQTVQCGRIKGKAG